MSEEKRIEEMAKLIAVKRGYGCNEQDHCDMSCQVFKVGCIPYEDAEILYNEGYRKQSEGEWIIKKGGYYQRLVCSVCEKLSIATFDYCPNCGAKMKGTNDEKTD